MTGVPSFESPDVNACHLGLGTGHNSVVTAGVVPALITVIRSVYNRGAYLAGSHSVATVARRSALASIRCEMKDVDPIKRNFLQSNTVRPVMRKTLTLSSEFS